jgi:hypothetical protein
VTYARLPMTERPENSPINLSSSSPVAHEAAAVAREILGSQAAIQTDPSLKPAWEASIRDAIARAQAIQDPRARAEWLGCLIASMSSLAVLASYGTSQTLAVPLEDAVRAVIRTAAERNFTFGSPSV